MSTLEELAAKALAREDTEPAIRFEGSWRSWGEVRHVAETVQHLVAMCGTPSRGWVLLIARNVPAVLAAFLGLVAKARNIRTVYSFQAPSAIAAEIAGLKPGVVVAAEQDFADEIRTAMRERGVAAIALCDMDASLLAGFERATANIDAGAPVAPTIEFQTSGTTGPPKRFPVTYEMAHRHFVERIALSAAGENSHERPPALLYMSLGNLSGMMSSLPALVLGQRMLLSDRFNLDAWCDYVRTYRPAHSGLQPAAVQMLLDADVPREDLASLRSLIIGSAPLDPKVLRAFEARYGITILLAYGATEFCGTVASMTPALRETWGEKKFGSVGPAVAGVQLRIADAETGEVLPPGKQGVLEVYYERLRPDWIRTSDLGIIDEDGFLFIRGRADGAIIRGGFKLLPETIERGLLCHEAVSVVAVVGVADRRLGQVPAAAIQFAPGAKPPSLEELKAHLRRQVPATHIPVHWRFVDDLPRTSSMKVDRRAVARLFEE
jgi:acyl-coenzyme A synthetase/AMP-(fatty) acid ligase